MRRRDIFCNINHITNILLLARPYLWQISAKNFQNFKNSEKIFKILQKIFIKSVKICTKFSKDYLVLLF